MQTPSALKPSATEKKRWAEGVMRLVRTEVIRRSGIDAPLSPVVTVSPVEVIELPRWSPSAPRLPAKTWYPLEDLLAFSDADFVHQCYRICLHRHADPTGFDHFLGRLRRGETSKVEVLGDIRFSHEGMKIQVHIDGLLLPYTLRRWMRKPIVGALLRWIHAFVRLGSIESRQQVLDAAQAREAQMLGHALNRTVDVMETRVSHIEALSATFAQSDSMAEISHNLELLGAQRRLDAQSLENLRNTIHEFADRKSVSQLACDLELLSANRQLDVQSLENLHIKVGDLEINRAEPDFFSARYEPELQQVHERISESQAQLLQATEEIKRLQGIAANLVDRASLSAVHKTATAAQEQIEGLHQASAALSLTTEALHAQMNAVEIRLGIRRPSPNQVEAAQSMSLDALYAAFEDTFRGSRELVRHRMEPYIDWVNQAGAGTREAPVLDVGCGRGEWLELLRDHQLIGRGLDLNRVFIDACVGRGLEVTLGDALTLLREIPEAAIGALTSMHLVEHLSYEEMITLLDEARRVLRPGGMLLLETPNPENITVGACGFYMDPTHRNPIPPEALRWTVQARGFHAARIERLSHGREIIWPGEVSDEVPGAATINAMSRAFVVPPDYAIIAVRP
jgi:SAM-dependent methyltransferase